MSEFLNIFCPHPFPPNSLKFSYRFFHSATQCCKAKKIKTGDLIRIIVPCCWKVVAQKWKIGKPKFHFPRDNFHFPRLDSCLAERSEAKQSKSRKMKVISRKMKMRLRDSPFQSNYFHAAWIYFLCF